MPIYEYQCPKCQTVFEEWQSGFEDREMECPECGESSKRLISHTAFHLKGGGWYADGYGAKNAGSAPAPSGSGDAGKSADTGGGGEAATPAKSQSSDSSSAGSAS